MKFEEYLEKLQNIVEDIESGEKSLDECIVLFNQGIEVSKSCLNILNDSKGKIVELKNEMGTIKESIHDIK